MVSDFNQLYYQDSYMRVFDAKILESRYDAKGLWLRLDQTAFYPEGGGQAGDRGTFAIEDVDQKLSIIDTIEVNGLIWHQTNLNQDINLDGRSVHGEIDWERRYDLMIQHSAEHIYSGLVNKHFNYDNVGFHISEDFMTIDFNGPLTADEVSEMEDLCNQAIRENIAYEIDYYDSAKAASVSYRSKIELPHAVRIVTVPGYDRCACCGTQVKHTGELGLLKVIDQMNYKGGVRLTLLAGQRALNDYKAKHNALKQISIQLSSPILETVEAVQRLESELTAEKAKQVQLTKRIVEAMSSQWPEQFEEASFLFAEGLTKEIHKALAKEMSSRVNSTVLLCSELHDQSILFSIASPSSTESAVLLNEIRENFGAKGGGKSNFLSGQIPAGPLRLSEVEKEMKTKGYKLYKL